MRISLSVFLEDPGFVCRDFVHLFETVPKAQNHMYHLSFLQLFVYLKLKVPALRLVSTLQTTEIRVPFSICLAELLWYMCSFTASPFCTTFTLFAPVNYNLLPYMVTHWTSTASQLLS